MAAPDLNTPEIQRLAEAIAAQTGESPTDAVMRALQQRYETLPPKHEKASFEELQALVRSIHSHLQGEPIDHGELLYGEDGLPK